VGGGVSEEITDGVSARAWLAEWGDQMRNGILRAVIDGIDRCWKISRSQGHREMTAGYAEALTVLRTAHLELVQRKLKRAAEIDEQLRAARMWANEEPRKK
jgi:hypothetical protein